MRILLAGGGSGGSATPVLAVAEEIRARDHLVELLYIGTSTGPEQALVAALNIPFHGVPAGKLRRYLSLENVTDVARVAGGLARSFQIVRGFGPHVAFGAGGFASVAPLWAARVLGVPVHIHQQDVIPGLANRLLVPAATSISVTFQQTLRHFPRRRSTLRGNPVRRSVLQGDARRFFQRFELNPELPLILVTGGGTGALRLNQIVAEAAPAMTESAQVLHLTGQGREVPAQTDSPRYLQRAFLVEEMADAMAAATIVISRAGLGTLSEIGTLGVASIIIPMPSSHQEANAAVFSRQEAALVLHEATLTPTALTQAALGLLGDSERRSRFAVAAGSLFPPDAAARVADDVLAIARG